MFHKQIFPDLLHPRRPRGGQLGQEKRHERCSRTGRRASGMLLLTNQFHDLFEYLSVIVFCVQSEASIFRVACVIFLYKGVYLRTRPLFAQTSLARAVELSSSKVFRGTRREYSLKPLKQHC